MKVRFASRKRLLFPSRFSPFPSKRNRKLINTQFQLLYFLFQFPSVTCLSLLAPSTFRFQTASIYSHNLIRWQFSHFGNSYQSTQSLEKLILLQVLFRISLSVSLVLLEPNQRGVCHQLSLQLSSSTITSTYLHQCF